MTKKLLITIAFLFFSINLYSQYDDDYEEEEYYGDFEESANLGIRPIVGLQYNIPLGERFATSYNSSIGYLVGLEYKVNQNLIIGVEANYHFFDLVDQSAQTTNAIESIPITAYLTFTLEETSNYIPYFGLKMGSAMYNTIKYIPHQNNQHIRYRYDKVVDYATIVPFAGVESKMSKNFYWNLDVRYNYIFVDNDFNTWIGINAGIKFEF